jgi:hypothetical protein
MIKIETHDRQPSKQLELFEELTPWLVQILNDVGPKRLYPESVATFCRLVFENPGGTSLDYDVKAEVLSILADALVPTNKKTVEMSDDVVRLAAALYPVHKNDFELSCILNESTKSKST